MKAKTVQVEYVSDIVFAPVAKSIKKNFGLETKWISWDIAQQIQRVMMPNDNRESHVLIIHNTKEFFIRNGVCEEELRSAFISGLESLLERENCPWVLINTIEVLDDSLVGIDRTRLLGILFSLNAKLVELTVKYSKLRLIDTASALAKLGFERSYNVKNDFIMKLPYKRDGVEALAEAYTRSLEEIFLPRKKVLAVDADNTLWLGVLGEDGVDGIKIDPTTYPGSAYWKFQKQLKAAKDSGLVLALVSKNNDEDMVEVFSKLRMPLSLEDFTIRRVNWVAKSENIRSIAETLNLGLDSFVFVDDNAFEIEQVRHACPMVDCYQFPAEAPEDGLLILREARNIGAWQLTSEDLSKTKLYAEEVKRQAIKDKSHSLEDYLKSLELQIEYGVNRVSELARISQLTNKTNQFNLTTRRYSELDIKSLMNAYQVYDFRIIDRYGDMGIVGVCILKGNYIDTFLMSCRALGREVEATMLKIVCDNNPGKMLAAEFIRSPKNQMVENFYTNNGFILVEDTADFKRFELEFGPKPLFEIPIKEVFCHE